MKRKFSFPASSKTAARPETGTPSHSQASSQSLSHSHRRHLSKDSICDSSPYISRRVLDPYTEQELRLSCRHILQHFKPSDHGMDNTDPKLDFGALQRRTEARDHKTQPSEVKVRMPTGAPAELASSFVAPKPSTKTRTRAKADSEIRARTQTDLPMRANSSRKRADFGWLDDRDEKREQNLKKFARSPSIDVPRSATFRADGDSGLSTPVTVASALAYSKSTSTAPTSASVTSGKNSNRRSRQLENPAAVADAQAAEWMRQELEKKRIEDASRPLARPSTASRPPTRGASIRNNIKDYVFPLARSRTLSRAQSQESLRTADNIGSPGSPHDSQRSASLTGWRSWGLHRSGSRSNSRPGTSRGQPDEPEQTRIADPNLVNLNRELPPLPGLDTWKEPVEPKDDVAKSPKSPLSDTHIASLMRPQEQHEERSPAARKQHRRSGSDSLAMHYTAAFPVRQSSRAKPEATTAALTMDTTAPSNDPQPSTSTHTHTYHRSSSGASNHNSLLGSPNGKSSLDALGPMPNFSRKISIDDPAHPSFSSTSSSFSTQVQIEHPRPRKDNQKSRLKSIFTGWITRKDNIKVRDRDRDNRDSRDNRDKDKDSNGNAKGAGTVGVGASASASAGGDWMLRLEKEGVKEGVMIQGDGPGGAPIVRY